MRCVLLLAATRLKHSTEKYPLIQNCFHEANQTMRLILVGKFPDHLGILWPKQKKKVFSCVCDKNLGRVLPFQWPDFRRLGILFAWQRSPLAPLFAFRPMRLHTRKWHHKLDYNCPWPHLFCAWIPWNGQAASRVWHMDREYEMDLSAVCSFFGAMQ